MKYNLFIFTLILLTLTGCGAIQSAPLAVSKQPQFWSFAEERFGHCRERPVVYRKLPALSRSFLGQVAKIDAFLVPEAPTAPDYATSSPMLKSLLAKCSACNDYERAELYTRLAFLEYAQNNTSNAIDAYLVVLSIKNSIPVRREQETLYTVAQLFAGEDDYSKAKSYFAQWEETCPTEEKQDYFYRLAQINYQLKDYTESMKNLDIELEMLKFNGRFIPTTRKRLKLALELELYGEMKSLEYAKELGWHNKPKKDSKENEQYKK